MGLNNSWMGNSSALRLSLLFLSPSSSPSLPPESSPSSPWSLLLHHHPHHSHHQHHHPHHRINTALAEGTTFHIISPKGFSPNLRIEEAKRNQFEPDPHSENHSAHNKNLTLWTPHHLMIFPNLKRRRIQEDGFHNEEVLISLNMEEHLENENDCFWSQSFRWAILLPAL